jgi:hypothetical protein
MLLELWERALKSRFGVEIGTYFANTCIEPELDTRSTIISSWLSLSKMIRYGWCTKMRVVSEPLTKVTLNLFTTDVEWFKQRYPEGYTERIREAIRMHVEYTEMENEYRTR